MEEKLPIIRLAEPKKKGLLSFVFSRLFLIIILIALQIVMMVGIYRWFSAYIPHFAAIQAVFMLVMLLYLYNCDMDASAKLTWMIVLAVFPIPGSIFLAYTRNNFGHRAITARTEEITAMTRHAIAQEEAVLSALAEDGSGTDDLYRYVNRSGCMPIFRNTEVA